MADNHGRNQDLRDRREAAVGSTPTTNGPQHVGQILRDQRLALGYSLPELAANLRIRLTYLEAIEEGRWADLPGHAYSTGFLRSYAQVVGLDPAAVLLRFKQDAAGHEPTPELYFPEPVNESRVPGGAILLIAGLLAVGVYGGWYTLSATDRSMGDMVPALPERLSKLIYGDVTTPSAPTPTTQVLAPGQVEALVEASQPSGPEQSANQGIVSRDTPADPTAADAPSAPPLPATDTSPVVAATGPAAEEDSEVPQLPDLGQTPAPPAEPSAELDGDASPVINGESAERPIAPAPTPSTEQVPATGRVFGQADGPVRITIRALEDSWIEVRDAKGTLWASRVLRRGDMFRAPDIPGLTLNTGNAGGLVVAVDGRDLAPLGAKSQIMRNLPLIPESLAGR